MNGEEIKFGRRFVDSIGGPETEELLKQIKYLSAPDIAKIILKLQHDMADANSTIFELKNRLNYAENHDVLTGALNKAGLRRAISLNRERLINTNIPFSVVILDIKKFKEINETRGYQFGDRVLKETYVFFDSILRKNDSIVYLEKEDATDSDNKTEISRFGGDEFIIILSGTTVDIAEVVMQRMNERLQLMKKDSAETDPLNFLDFRYAIKEWDSGSNIDSFFEDLDKEMFEKKREE